MLPLRSIPGIIAWPLGSVRVAVNDAAAPVLSADGAARWEAMCAANPKHFDGPLLSVVSFDPERGEVICRRDGYARLAVQPEVHTGVQQLSVTGLLTAVDGGGRKHCLVGRRSHETRIFGGMWEVGPSGGIPPPGDGVEEVSASALLQQLVIEVQEEVGLVINDGRVVAYVRDEVAHSDDIVIECDLGSLEAVSRGPANWEYTEVRWVPLDTTEQFDTENSLEIIGATRAIWRVLGWIDGT